jgi:hypothetical protein
MSTDVSYDATTKTLKIADITVEVGTYSNENVSTFVKLVRNEVSKIMLSTNISVSNFYNSDGNMFMLYTPDASSKITREEINTVEVKETIRSILDKLKEKTRTEINNIVKASNSNSLSVHDELKKNEPSLLGLLMVSAIVTKILTGVFVVQSVEQVSCQADISLDTEMKDIDKKISEMKQMVKDTSNLLFRMDAI